MDDHSTTTAAGTGRRDAPVPAPGRAAPDDRPGWSDARVVGTAVTLLVGVPVLWSLFTLPPSTGDLVVQRITQVQQEGGSVADLDLEDLEVVVDRDHDDELITVRWEPGRCLIADRTTMVEC